MASENLDSLNAWLEKIEKEISSQESVAEDVHSLKSQIKAIKLKFTLKQMFRPEVGNSFWLAGHIGKKIGLRGPVLSITRLKIKLLFLSFTNKATY